MKLHLVACLVLAIVLAEVWRADAGIIRRSRRVHNRLHGRPPTHFDGTRLGRSGYWRERLAERRREQLPHFLAAPRRRRMWARNSRRFRFSPFSERQDFFGQPPQQRPRQPLMSRPNKPWERREALMSSASNPKASWKPVSDFGSPIARDPIFDYAPSSVERIRLGKPERRRNKPAPGQPGKPPRMQNKNTHVPPHHHRRPPLFDKPIRRPPTGPALWKLLAAKQSRLRYQYQQQQRLKQQRPFMRYPENKPRPFKNFNDVPPQLKGMVYFKPTDVLSNNPKPTPAPGFKSGVVSDAPLYSSEVQSSSQFNPITTTTMKSPPSPIDILYTPHKFINPTTPRSPAVLEPVSAISPIVTYYEHHHHMEPQQPQTEEEAFEDETDALLDIIHDPPKPLSSFNNYNHYNLINSDHIVHGEESKVAENLIINNEKPRPVFEPASEFRPSPRLSSTIKPEDVQAIQVEEGPEEVNPDMAVSVQTSVSSSTSYQVKQVPVASPQATTTTTTTTPKSTTTTTTTTTEDSWDEVTKSFTSTAVEPTTTVRNRFGSFKMPEMPTYKKRQPIYPRRQSPPSSKSTVGGKPLSIEATSKEATSGERPVITFSRSKVKEYKPQFLAGHKQFLSFDKVSSTEDEANVTDVPKETVTLAPVTIVSSTPFAASNSTDDSPLSEFDPMQLVHSWFQSS